MRDEAIEWPVSAQGPACRHDKKNDTQPAIRAPAQSQERARRTERAEVSEPDDGRTMIGVPAARARRKHSNPVALRERALNFRVYEVPGAVIVVVWI